MGAKSAPDLLRDQKVGRLAVILLRDRKIAHPAVLLGLDPRIHAPGTADAGSSGRV